MKLTNILTEQDTEGMGKANLIKQVDPKTGEEYFRVEYNSLYSVDSKLDGLYYTLKKAVQEHPSDPYLENLLRSFATWKKQYKTYVNRKYPSR